MKSWGVLPSDNTVWWVILWIVMTVSFAGVAWFIMVVIDYYVVLPARTEFAIWVGLTWLLIWQVGARIAAHERWRFGRS
jgi:glycerol-3-phosphate acyltransferase PlsY